MTMPLDWFDARPAQQFGAALAAFYVAKLPPDMDKEEKKYLNKKEFVTKKMSEQIVQFKTETRLNIYKRAQVGNAFKWTLKDAGYPTAEIDQLTASLIRQL
jgi:hypothetical protein